MAEAATEFLLQNLRELLTRHNSLIKGAEEEIKKLENDLSLFMAFLRDFSKKQRKDDKVQELLRVIRDVIYDAEDIVDAFVQKALKSRGSVRKFFDKDAVAASRDLHRIAQVVRSVSEKVRDIYESSERFAILNVEDEDPAEVLEVPRLRKAASVVGFNDDAAKLIGYLKEETDGLDVISIVGMPGLGKTTLTWMIFNHPEIQYEFPTRVWVYVSADFTTKDVCLTILKELKTNFHVEMYRNCNDHELAYLVAAELERGKFLIVMDDVWTPADWAKLRTALPDKGKVLLTSRQVEVGRFANLRREPHYLRFLTYEESSVLLCLEALGKSVFPQELENLGKRIARQCDGLPLAIVVIGGILAGKYSARMSQVEREWEKVSRSVSTYLTNDPQRRMESIISLSYNKLPHHLRFCFLYLAMFPKDYEIPVWKLIYMWIAEGFIQPNNNMSMEEIAENYLEELINRNFIIADKMAASGRVKTCRIHDIMHEFCKIEAENERENFLKEIKKSSNGGFQPPISSLPKFRRLCIHYSILDFLSSKPYGPRVRSFVCFSKDGIELKYEAICEMFTAFKLLRVLDVKPIKLSKFSTDLFKLVHLKYIHLSLNLDILPYAFSKLWNIQTLIVDTTSRTLEIKADIWVMIHLRHLKTNASATLPKPGKHSEGGEKLQTLGTISPHSCTKEVLDKACNLKKLGVCGNIAPFLQGKIGSFESLVKLFELENLKLVNDASSDGQLYGLPPYYTFPPKLRMLTLSGTSLEWKHMSILGSLENLHTLKLKDRAFMGESWNTTDGGFCRLKVLYIGHSDLKFWKASAQHFPELRQLKLANCDELQEIPIELADIPSLQLLELHFTKLAAPSAKKIRDAKRKEQELEPTAQISSEFKLSLFPYDE